MFRMTLLPVLFVLGACAPTPPDDVITPIEPIQAADPVEQAGVEGSGLGEIELCDAQDYRHLLGAVAASQTFPIGPEFRVYGVDDIITQEYLPNRTNVVVNQDGLVARVYCG